MCLSLNGNRIMHMSKFKKDQLRKIHIIINYRSPPAESNRQLSKLFQYLINPIIFLGARALDQVIFVLLTTSMWVGGIVGFFLDITLPGTEEERGILKWRKTHEQPSEHEDKIQIASIHTYDIPYVTSYLQKFSVVRYIPFLPYFDQIGDIEDLNNGNCTKGDGEGNCDSDKETRM